jgi:Fe-S-cluster-containing hydrogenase component 2/CRP-like cAMP-binding protein
LYPSPAFKDKLNRTYKSRAIEFTIRSSPVFRDLSEDLLEEICSRAELADFEPDQIVCHRGDEVKYLDFIRLGFVKLSQDFPGGELVLAYLSRNAYFGESGLLPVLRVRTQGGQSDRKAECVVSTTPIKVGRAATAPDDLAIPWDEYISRGDHAELSVEGNRLKVVRRQGKNPIGYGGALMDTARVAPGETFVLGQTTFEVEDDPLTNGRHSATCTATDFVQLVRIRAEDFPRILEASANAESAIAEVAKGRRQIESQLLGRVQQVSLEDFLDHDLMQGQNLLLLDLDRCTRCDECVKACAATHDDGAPRLVRDGLRFQQYLVATSCRACMDPLCMTHCPVGAIRRKGSSLDIVIEDWCIGCCNCAQDCPYGAINVMDLTRTNGHAPAAGQAPKPRAVVCDLCHDFAEPNCVRACPHDAAIRVQPRFFFARDLAGVQLAVTPKLPPPLLAEAHNETKIFSSASELLKLIPRLELVVPPGGEDPLPVPHPRSFLLRNPGSTSFGREADNDCVLRNDSVSKKQAIIECHGARFVLRNISEANVTWVNDRPAASEVELHPGDVLEMGEVRLKFLVGQMQ